MGFDKNTTICVRNLSPEVTQKIGDVKKVVLVTDKQTEKSKGFAFVEFPIALLASEALTKCDKAKLNDNDKPISVRPYTDKKEAVDKKKPIKEKKEKKPKGEDALSKDDPFYVSSSDEEDDEDEDEKPDKNGIFPNRVLVVARLSKASNWDKTMEGLQTKFSKIGKVSNIRMPKQGSQHKGYAFIEFRKAKHAKRALEWAKKNTKMSVSFKVDRDQYVKKKQDAFLKKKEDEFDQEQERFQKHMKKYTEGEKSDDEDIEEPEEYFGEEKEAKTSNLDELFDGEEKEDNSESDGEDDGDDEDVEDDQDGMSDDEDATDDADEMEDAPEPAEEGPKEKKEQTAADFKKTVFVQNLPFQAGVDEIKTIFEKHYGLVAYVAIVAKTDGLSSGKAFVKFKRFKDAKKCIREAEGNLVEQIPEKKKASEKISKETEEEERNVGEVLLDGRKLLIARAISKQGAQEINKKKEKKDDPRNLRLAKIGFIAANSPEAKEMPADHLKKIQKNWAEKNTKLNNPIYHISPTRLAIQNMPKSWTDKDLKSLILDKVKYDEVLGAGKKPKLIQVKIAKDKESKQSKGFGFVEFEKHEAALCALERLNNNPKILNARVKDNKVASAQRLIVEFAVENTMKLTVLRRHQTNSHRVRDDDSMLAEYKKAKMEQTFSSDRPPARNNRPQQRRQRGGSDNKRKRQDNNSRGAKKTKK